MYSSAMKFIVMCLWVMALVMACFVLFIVNIVWTALELIHDVIVWVLELINGLLEKYFNVEP